MTGIELYIYRLYCTRKSVIYDLLMATFLLAGCSRGAPIQPLESPAPGTPTTPAIFTWMPSPGQINTESPIPTEIATRVPPTPTATTPPSPTPTSTPLIPPLPLEPALITNGSRALPYIALTFDLCQKPEYPARFDEKIYEALIAAGAPATFFMGGDWARTHPDEARRLAANPNFEIGNHSWTHPDLIDLNADQINEQITLAQEMIAQTTGRTPRLFRLPAGLYNAQVLELITRAGLYTIQWDVVTADPVPDNSAENINRIVREEAQNGSIIIMHANGRGWNTAEALPEMIAYLREAGFRLVTVSQLLGLEPLPIEVSGE